MEWIAAMQQAITYMEEHLLEEINYEVVAKQVHTSGYEFHRAFSFLTGMTANAYIRNRRLSLAGREIVETDTKITDIALKYGYDTPESYLFLQWVKNTASATDRILSTFAEMHTWIILLSEPPLYAAFLKNTDFP